MTDKVTPFSLKDAPSLIEYVFPVQKLSIDVYKERTAATAQILTSLGNFWKGRKPLVLNKACILGALLPKTLSPVKDLEIFELLMGMDESSLKKRLGLDPSAELSSQSYKECVSRAKRVDEVNESVDSHIWPIVNSHLGTFAYNFTELVNQLGLMRFGRNPKVADTFSGSGQIPFEAARLGCDVYASDLNPISCMLTWGAMNIVGASSEDRLRINEEIRETYTKVESEMILLGFEIGKKDWLPRNHLYCLEVKCPESGWLVPLIPSMIISEDYGVIAQLIPDQKNKRYEIELVHGVSADEMKLADKGTVRSDGKGKDPYLYHVVDGREIKVKISTIRGDYKGSDGVQRNRLRQWECDDIRPLPDDIFQERLYAIIWAKPKDSGRGYLLELRAATKDDCELEDRLARYVEENLSSWQKLGLIPDMKIESGEKTDEPIRTRGWTFWHHLFNPRQLLLAALIKKHSTTASLFPFVQVLNYSSRLSRWSGKRTRGYGNTVTVFDNQALNTLLTYGSRTSLGVKGFFEADYKSYPIAESSNIVLRSHSASELNTENDFYITDPPYGDAVKYEEIYEYFIAWLKNNPPKEFANWIWDSRRAIAVKGEDHDFKLAMVKSYQAMTNFMPDNGIQIVMFTHQSGSIWADMANIVWASGLKVSAAWYIVTETDSALREGQYVKGTILLVLRKRDGHLESFRDELAYEIKEEVEKQVEILTGLNIETKDLHKVENLFEDADIQMAGYAAALRVLTKYATVDGVDMPTEAIRPRIKGQKTLVDDLIEFAVNIANQYLVPQGLTKEIWSTLIGSERFYLKMLDMESKGVYSISNYQNFAKAFKVADFSSLIGDTKANKTQLKSAETFGKRGMGSVDDFGTSNVRCILFAILLLIENKLSSDDVLHQLKELIPDFYRNRDVLIAISDYISRKTSGIREIESQSARVLRDLIRNERV